jgi:RNA polymerase sigma-70 factor (ECF subfamily)
MVFPPKFLLRPGGRAAVTTFILNPGTASQRACDTPAGGPYIVSMDIESELPNRFLAGIAADEPDWEVVYVEQLPRVYNFFRYRCGDETLAEDLTSRTFEKAWRARQRYRRDLAGFGTWLLSIARNVAVDHFRASRPQSRLEEIAEPAANGTPEEDNAVASDLERLVTLVEQLPEREQELIAFKYGAEASNRTIARLTGLSESNVGTILHRAVNVLRERW